MFKDGLATKTDYVTVYNYNENGEFTGESTILVEEGTGIPAQSTLEKVNKEKKGFARVFDKKWTYVEDHRYKTAYDINTKQEFEIDYFGELKEEHTLLAPPSQDHDFVKGKWVITKEKKAELKEREEAQAEGQKQAQISELKLRLQVHLLMGEEEEAKALVLEIRALQK